MANKHIHTGAAWLATIEEQIKIIFAIICQPHQNGRVQTAAATMVIRMVILKKTKQKTSNGSKWPSDITPGYVMKGVYSTIEILACPSSLLL